MTTVARILYWGGGFLFFLLLLLLIPKPLLPVSISLLSWVATGLVFEVLLGPSRSSAHLSASPADGLVELVPLPGVLASPNTADPRFARLLDLEPAPRLARKPPRALLGRLRLVPLFHSRGTKGWTDPEIAQALDAVLRVGVWIEHQAQRYQAPLNVQLSSHYLRLLDPLTPESRPLEFALEPEQGGLAPFESDTDIELIASASRALSSLNIPQARDLPQLIHTLAARLDTDHLAWLLFSRSAGRSFASREHDLGLPSAHIAVIYAAENDLPGPLLGPPRVDPATIAHELLHLFGASDKYGRSLRDYPPGAVSSRDIMRLSESRLSRLQIDPRTASELLWPPHPNAHEKARRNTRVPGGHDAEIDKSQDPSPPVAGA